MGLLGDLIDRIFGPRPDPDPPKPPAPPAPPPTPGQLGRTAPESLPLINRSRGKPLAWDDRLASAAMIHSEDQARRGRLGHKGSDGSQFWDRAARAGFDGTPAGECVSWGQADAGEAVRGWMRSLPHRMILTAGGSSKVGVAVATGDRGRNYWTAVTGK